MTRTMSPQELEAAIREVGAERYHDKHPFHRLLHGGELGKGQVEAARRFRSGLHRHAEAGRRRARTVDRDEDRLLAPHRVVSVAKLVAEKNPVLHGDRREVECVPGELVVDSTDAALTEDDVRVASGEHVFGGEQPLLDTRPHAALQQHRPAGVGGRLEQRVIRHVAGADLQDVRIGRDDVDVALREHLGDGGHLIGPSGILEQPESILAEPAEGVRRGPRLEGPATQDPRAALANGSMLDLPDLLARA